MTRHYSKGTIPTGETVTKSVPLRVAADIAASVGKEKQAVELYKKLEERGKPIPKGIKVAPKKKPALVGLAGIKGVGPKKKKKKKAPKMDLPTLEEFELVT
jgi:hypothetical protein